jgi:hypothetical protein
MSISERRDYMAIICVTPDVDITALIASAGVSEGDVLLLAEGTYDQSVIISKNYVRILSERCGAVFDGNNILATAFILNNVTGVELYGLVIQNYLSTGVTISGGSANRIICNRITNVGTTGIRVSSSSANVIWKNHIRNVSDGVLLINGSTNNWILENKVKNCRDDGFESFLSNDLNNTFVGNLACNCSDNCFEIYGVNNLVYCNSAIDGTNSGYVITSGSNTVAIGNKSSGGPGPGVSLGSNNALIACGTFKNNDGTGLTVNSDFNIILSNLITCNRNSGLVINEGADNNFIIGNHVLCNTPHDIAVSGTNNNLLKNLTGC